MHRDDELAKRAEAIRVADDALNAADGILSALEALNIQIAALNECMVGASPSLRKWLDDYICALHDLPCGIVEHVIIEGPKHGFPPRSEDW